MPGPSLPVAVSALLSLLSALLASLFVHWLTRRRDRSTARQQQRLAYLLAAYRKLEGVAHRDLASNGKQLEEAFAEIMLFGDSSHVQHAQRVAHSLSTNGDAPIDDLLLALRGDLRSELGLSELPLETVPALRVGTPQDDVGVVWEAASRIVKLNVPAKSTPAVSATRTDPSGAVGDVTRAPGAVVMTARRNVEQALRVAVGNQAGDHALEMLDLARRAQVDGTISSESLTALEGLEVMARLSRARGSGTGLTLEQALDYVALAETVIYAIRAEAVRSQRRDSS